MPSRRRKAANQASNADAKKAKINGIKKEASDEKIRTRSQRGKKRKDESAVSLVPDVPIKRERTSVKVEPGVVGSPSKDEEKGEIKKIKFTGTIPVDEHCTECSNGYHVYIDSANNDIFNTMLNQTNIGFNNNKYYILQLLKHNSTPQYVVWFRWGRVGKVAGTALKRFGGNLEAAKETFLKKFHDKTKNLWEFRADFVKVQGKYDLLEMDYGEEDPDIKKKEEEKRKEKKEIKSMLDDRVAQVIDLIFDLKEFEASVKEMEFDVKKAPLGKLTTKQIKAGFQSLKKIETCINGHTLGRKLADACSEFYTRIPHDFGMRCPPLIRTPAELKRKIELLEALSDIQIAIQLIDNGELQDKNPKDVHYESLGCKLEPFHPDHDEFKMVYEYVKHNHGSTHNLYSLEVENVFRLVREEDESRFKKDIGNRMLLWHGSRLTNWCGILKQGLRIAPPEAPVTGYMFGKGIYFSDMVTKSANYCFANCRQPVGFLILCEVALGNVCEKKQADYSADKLPPGKHSVKGIGREVPDPQTGQTLNCGTVVPLAKKKMTVNDKELALQYNEYIVYDVAQVHPRYLVQTRFKFENRW